MITLRVAALVREPLQVVAPALHVARPRGDRVRGDDDRARRPRPASRRRSARWRCCSCRRARTRSPRSRRGRARSAASSNRHPSRRVPYSAWCAHIGCPRSRIASATCSPVSMVVSGRVTMSASIATAILRDRLGAASPDPPCSRSSRGCCVGLGRERRRCRGRRAPTATPFATTRGRRRARSTGRTPRIGRAIARSSASRATSANASARTPRNDTICAIG